MPYYNYDKIFSFRKFGFFLGLSYNHFHNVLGLFDVLSFPFTTSETKSDY